MLEASQEVEAGAVGRVLGFYRRPENEFAAVLFERVGTRAIRVERLELVEPNPRST